MRSLPLLMLCCAEAAPTASAAETNEAAARIVGAALVGGGSYDIARSLTDGVGQRLAGSPAAERAVAWALAELQRAGITNAHREPVKVSRWVRGDAEVALVAPSPQPMHAVALGGSVGTAPGGITAEVVEVASLDDLKALGAKAKGKIVLYNRAMARSEGFDSYGAVVPMRGAGAIAAAQLGAVGALIRLVGTGAYRLPHTGATRYQDGVTKIPFAAVAAEDADLIHRLLAAGEPVRVRLRLGCKLDGTVESANVVGELPGGEHADEIVLVGAHLDSWDLGTGAIDDAAGCAMVIDVARILLAEAARGGRLRRTVRLVLFMNEEHGLDGARAYAAQHEKELPKHVAALEADSGAGRPLGIEVVGGPKSVGLLTALAAPLVGLRAASVRATEFGGADLIPLQAHGVPVVDVRQDVSTYFDWHHTAADTFDKIDRIDLALSTAALAVIVHGLAASPEVLPPSAPPPKL